MPITVAITMSINSNRLVLVLKMGFQSQSNTMAFTMVSGKHYVGRRWLGRRGEFVECKCALTRRG